MAANNVIPLPKRKTPRTTRDVVADAYDRGCPSPLAAMLDNLAFWHNLAADLAASGDPENGVLGRMARMQSQRCAVDCAQYVHPKLNAVASQVEVEHHYPLVPSPISRLSDEAAERLLQRVTAGEVDILLAIDELQ